jgi:hypothetical protein
MPWSARDAKKHTKKANTAKKKRQWSHVANSVLKRGGSEGSAVRQANAVVARDKDKKAKRVKAAKRILKKRKKR